MCEFARSRSVRAGTGGYLRGMRVEISSVKGGINCVNLLISVRMRALSAPHMSFGSRATQAKPEARTSCSERLLQAAFFMRGTGVRVRERTGLGVQIFLHAERALHRCATRCYGKTRVDVVC
jgi:hypothetical protein